MKKIIFLLFMAILLLTLSGCGTIREMNDTSSESKVERSRFLQIENYGFGSVIVDRETNVEYWVSKGTYNYGTLTLLVDRSGRPKLRE